MTTSHYQHGIVLGKFMPPHHGHRVVISAALAASSKVTIIVSVLPTDAIPADLRVAWLQQLYPRARVVRMTVSWDVTDAAAWARGVRSAAESAIDAVFSSEQYGHVLANLLGCTNVDVDHDRTIVPISATTIRHNPKLYRAYLDPIVWEYFANQSQS